MKYVKKSVEVIFCSCKLWVGSIILSNSCLHYFMVMLVYKRLLKCIAIENLVSIVLYIQLAHLSFHNANWLNFNIVYLMFPSALETEGIFRRSANVTLIKEFQARCDAGAELDFNNNPHIPAVLLKSFLRDLEEPILTFDLYDEICAFPCKSHSYLFSLNKTDLECPHI